MGEIEVEEYIHTPVDGELRVDDYRIIEETLVFDKKVLKDDQGQILYLDSIGNVVAIVKRDHTAKYIYASTAALCNHVSSRWILLKRENLKNSGVFKIYSYDQTSCKKESRVGIMQLIKDAIKSIPL